MVFPSLGDVWKLRDCAWQYYVAMLVATVAVLIPFVLREEPDMMGRTISVQPKFVTDGNTFYGTMAGEGKMVRLRLRLVDAPEMDQPYGREARLFLRHMLVDDAPAEVMCRVTGTDGWGGLIVDVVTRHSPSRAGNDDDDDGDARSVQEEMVRHGWAWAMGGGFAPNSRLRAIMEEAREARRGLWRDNKPVEPRMHRRTKRKDFHTLPRAGATASASAAEASAAKRQRAGGFLRRGPKRSRGW